MLRIHPFAALRPRPDVVAHVASVAYDVVDRAEAKALAEGNPLSFLRVVRSEIDLPDHVDPYADEVYAKAASNFRKLQTDGYLIRENKRCVYLYRQEMELGNQRLSQIGVVCCCHIDDYEQGLIKKHEKTRQNKEDDRTRHVSSINANAGPVFLMYQDDANIHARVAHDVHDAPLYDFVAADGVRHTVWRIDDPSVYVRALSQQRAAYVADGHHRCASAARAGAEQRAGNPQHTGEEEYNWFLAVLFPASHLHILPYHRVIRDLHDANPDTFLERLRSVGDLRENSQPQSDSSGSFGVYLNRRWYRLRLAPDASDGDPVASPDYQRLYDRVLAPLLGISDIRTDQRIDFVGGIRGCQALERRVDSGEMAVAFAMPAVHISQLMAVADAGQIMPPKSTWFEPKLRSGLLIHTLD